VGRFFRIVFSKETRAPGLIGNGMGAHVGAKSSGGIEIKLAAGACEKRAQSAFRVSSGFLSWGKVAPPSVSTVTALPME